MSKTKIAVITLVTISISVICIFCCCMSSYLFIFDNSFFGRGCLYDDGTGFTSLSNGQSITTKDGKEVRCVNGKLEF